MTELKKRVLDALNELGGCGAKPGSYEKGWDDAIDAAWRAVKALDDAAQEARWIPVTERLPENIGLYLVIERHWIDGSPVRKIAKWNTVDWFTSDRKSKEITPRVSHWMPLPEPPKEEKL